MNWIKDGSVMFQVASACTRLGKQIQNGNKILTQQIYCADKCHHLYGYGRENIWCYYKETAIFCLICTFLYYVCRFLFGGVTIRGFHIT